MLAFYLFPYLVFCFPLRYIHIFSWEVVIQGRPTSVQHATWRQVGVEGIGRYCLGLEAFLLILSGRNIDWGVMSKQHLNSVMWKNIEQLGEWSVTT